MVGKFFKFGERSIVQRNSSILWRELDGEAVLLSPSAGSSYNLNQVGTFIWKMLDGKHSLHDIATAVCEAYDVEYEQACQDVESLLTDMRDNNLLSDAPASQTAV